MSSLLQFNGQVQRKGVGLEMYLTRKVPVLGLGFEHFQDESVERIDCPQCGGKHEQLYRVWRKPVGMFGCWVVFRYNGKENVPDLSCPINVEKLPRGAEKLSAEDNAKAWHRS